MAFREVLAWHEKHRRMPLRTHDGPEDELARKWRRWRASSRLTPAARGLQMRVQALAAKSEAARQDDRRAARVEQALRAQQQHWREDNNVHDDDWWRRPALHRSCGGRHPYPSFANLLNTCYLNAPLQCLLHCPAARAALLGAVGEGEPLVVQDACRVSSLGGGNLVRRGFPLRRGRGAGGSRH